METKKLIILFATMSSMLFSCAAGGESSESSKGSSTSSSGTTSVTSQTSESTSKTTSQEASSSSSKSSSSRPTYDDLDHVKIFVSKDTNTQAYTHIYAWKGSGMTAEDRLAGDWPGTNMTSYDNDWLSVDFDKQYTIFSVIFSHNGDDQTGHDGFAVNGIGAYWFYEDNFEKSSIMPDIHPEPDPSSSSQDPDTSGSTPTPSGEHEGNIFHAFDWSVTAIKNKLNEIAAAGYTAVQTSPLQRSKEYNGNQTNYDWWRLYQPATFDVAGCYLGTAAQLQQLTTAAHSKNIKIIVDIVANHVGGNGDSPDGEVISAIRDHTSETLRHEGQCNDWGNRYDVTHKRIGGYPELNTANTNVQNIVYNYLKQLIDNGVDGFRFDAAKHIETPYDNNSIKSSFWTNTATKAYKYASDTYGKKLYMYGEILDNCGGVGFDYYTQILDGITDNRTGNGILSAVQNGNSSGAASSHYFNNVDPSKLVLWGESHDTYMNTIEYGGITRNSEQKNVDKAYALVATRKGARALYFCRPTWNAKIGSGETQNTNYKNKLVTAVNKLKNDMGNNNETLASSGSIAYVARHGENGYGATIVNVSGSGSAKVTISNLPNGTYKDLISGTTYTLTSGSVTVNISSEFGATVIEKI